MSTFHGGPAADLHLLFARGPVYLRVVQGPEGFDVLDQPEDEPAEHETVYVYRRVGENRRAHINNRGSRGKGPRSGFYEFADYQYVEVEPEERERLRDTAAWQAWATEERVLAACPACGALVEDLDGFGILIHPECGYCSHPSATTHPTGDTQCDSCGVRV